MQSISARWLRALLGCAVLGYSASYAWLSYGNFQGFVIDPYCIVLLSIAFVVSFYKVRWGLLLGIATVSLEVFISLLFAGDFLSEPTIIVPPVIILVSMLFLGRRVGAVAATLIATMVPLAIWLSGMFGWGPGLFETGVMRSLIVFEVVNAVTAIALYAHATRLEQIHAVRSQENERFRLLVESMPEGVVLISPQGVIEEFNPAAEQMLQVRREQAIGHVLDYKPLGFPQEMLNVALSLKAADVCLGDKRGCLEVTPSSTSWKGGPPRVLLVLRDVSAKKQYEQQSEELRDQLIRSQKFEAVGRLAAGVAHDFNNILTVISGYIGLRQLEELSESDPVTDMNEAVMLGTKLVRQLLVFSKDEPSAQSVIDVTQAVQRVEPILQRLVGENVDLVCRCDDLCTIMGSYGKLEQVLVNLATNARDAMPGGGSLTIASALESDEVVLRVSDSGHGIPEEIRDKIFDMFFSTKEASQGTGLGLATVYAVVTEFQGVIEVESSSAGTTFVVRWPLARQDISVEPSRLRALSPPHLLQKRVLLVEDNHAARVMLTRYLQKQGFVVQAVESGTHVLNDPTLWNKPPDIIVTDLVMPGISGIELINLMREHWGAVPFLLMSGYTADTLADEPSETLEHLIEKPFPPSDLVSRITEALAQAEIANIKMV